MIRVYGTPLDAQSVGDSLQAAMKRIGEVLGAEYVSTWELEIRTKSKEGIRKKGGVNVGVSEFQGAVSQVGGEDAYPYDRYHVIRKGACKYVTLVQGKVRVCDRGGWPIKHDVPVDHDAFPKIGAGSISLKGRACGGGEH